MPRWKNSAFSPFRNQRSRSRNRIHRQVSHQVSPPYTHNEYRDGSVRSQVVFWKTPSYNLNVGLSEHQSGRQSYTAEAPQ